MRRFIFPFPNNTVSRVQIIEWFITVLIALSVWNMRLPVHLNNVLNRRRQTRSRAPEPSSTNVLVKLNMWVHKAARKNRCSVDLLSVLNTPKAGNGRETEVILAHFLVIKKPTLHPVMPSRLTGPSSELTGCTSAGESPATAARRAHLFELYQVIWLLNARVMTFVLGPAKVDTQLLFRSHAWHWWSH